MHACVRACSDPGGGHCVCVNSHVHTLYCVVFWPRWRSLCKQCVFIWLTVWCSDPDGGHSVCVNSAYAWLTVWCSDPVEVMEDVYV